MGRGQSIGMFMLGFVCGMAALWAMVMKPAAENFQAQYLVEALSQANIALQLGQGRQTELLARVEKGFPVYVKTIHDHFPDNPRATAALWLIRDYYHKTHKPIPAEMKETLDAVPADPPRQDAPLLRVLEKGDAPEANTDTSSKTNTSATPIPSPPPRVTP